MPWFLTPSIKGGKTRSGRPAHIHGWIQLNGASNPTVWSELISGVRRLEDAGASPFFRVALVAPQPLTTGLGAITFGVRPLDEATAFVAQDLTGVVTAVPADAANANEFDIGVYPRNGTGDDRVDTLGVRIFFTIGWYE